jgi:hypothetical protein
MTDAPNSDTSPADLTPTERALRDDPALLAEVEQAVADPQPGTRVGRPGRQ